MRATFTRSRFYRLCRRQAWVRFLALLICRTDLSVIALIGIILLIGIVKKNAIMMIDFALEAERQEGKSPQEAIYQACLLRFRPIMMTTMAALFGALPLALGTGVGSELRRPLGIAIVGGLIVSQMLTLYTTPVVYLYLDGARLWFQRLRTRRLRRSQRRCVQDFSMKGIRPMLSFLLRQREVFPSFSQRRESRFVLNLWIPALAASAGMTFVCVLMKKLTDTMEDHKLPKNPLTSWRRFWLRP